MVRLLPAILVAPLVVAASAPVMPAGETLDSALKRARAEQAAAETKAKSLQASAAKAANEADKLRAEQVAAAQAVEAAEAQITASDVQLRLISASIAARQMRLEQEQQPISSLLAGLTMMARRPPLLAIAGGGSTDEFVKVRVLLDSTLPVIRARTAALSTELAEGQRLKQRAGLARQELVRSREQLASRRQQFAALEQKALAVAASTGGEALGVGDVALSEGENIEQLRQAQTEALSASAIASQLASLDPAPPRPSRSTGRYAGAPFAYALPSTASVVEGLGSVDESGVKARGLTLATGRGATLTVPANGTVKFSGAYRSHNGVVIIDHGGGWMSLIVNVGSDLKAGDRVRLGEPLGRALGPISVELSQNGRRMSPALIAGSSLALSNKSEGG